MIYGALLWMADKLKGDQGEHAQALWTAWKHARFQIAQARLRPEKPTIYVAWEHLNFTRGDRLRLQHDVMLIGQIAGRVKASSDPNVTLDEIVTMQAGKGYGIRYRQNDGTLIFRRVHTVPGETKVVALSATTPGAPPDIGALFAFGEWDGTASDSGVFRVFAITTQDDLCAQVTLVDDAPAISLADQGVIPDYEPNITAPVDPFHLPPRDLRLTEVIEGRGTSARALVVLSWQAPPRGAIAVYRVQWRDDGATESVFRDVGTAISPQTTFTLRDIPIGVQSFRVRTEFSDGTFSSWATLASQSIQGLLGVPPDVTNFRISVLGETSALNWDAIVVENLLGYELRFSPLTSGVSWNASTELLPLITSQSAQVATRTGTYLIKAVTAQGIYSANATLIISLVDVANRNVVEVMEEDPDFLGVRDGTIVEDELLVLAIDNPIASWDALANVITLAAGLSDVPAINTEGTYYFESGLDLGDVYSSRLTVAVAAFGLSLTADVFAPEDFFEPEDFFGDAGINDWSVTVEVRTTDSDPLGAPTWSAWAPVIAGDYRARAFEFRAVLRSFRADVTPAVARLAVTIDMPDRIVAAEDVVVPPAGLTIAFEPPFKSLKALNVTGQDLATGDRLAVTAKTEAGALQRRGSLPLRRRRHGAEAATGLARSAGLARVLGRSHQGQPLDPGRQDLRRRARLGRSKDEGRGRSQLDRRAHGRREADGAPCLQSSAGRGRCRRRRRGGGNHAGRLGRDRVGDRRRMSGARGRRGVLRLALVAAP